MDETLRQNVIGMLMRGEDLPREWARDLFPTEKREIELVYPDKERAEDILASKAGAYLCPMSALGQEDGGWRNRLIWGDNLAALHALLKLKERGELLNVDGTAGVRLVYSDPPFATRRAFHGREDQRAYEDLIAGPEYVEFLRKRLVVLRELLTPDGCIFVHLDWRKGPHIRLILDEVFGEANFRNEIIVRRTQKPFIEGQRIASLNVGFDTLYLYAASAATRFSPVHKKQPMAESWHALDAPNWSGTRPRLVYDLFGHMPPQGRCWAWEPERAQAAVARGDLRPNAQTGKPEYRILAREQVLCTNLWDDVSAYAFATGYPTEKSEKLLWRIIEMGSRQGDLVLDAFAGSGTTCAVAEKLGRRWIGIDCGKLAVHTVQKRVLSLRSGMGKQGKPVRPRPFSVYRLDLGMALDETRGSRAGDASGFDPMQPPEVGWRASLPAPDGESQREACLQITRFESRAQHMGRRKLEGLAALSMVMLDLAYDGSTFRPSKILHAQDLVGTDWQARFPIREVGAQMMVALVDIGGNEARLLIRGEAFVAGERGCADESRAPGTRCNISDETVL